MDNSNCVSLFLNCVYNQATGEKHLNKAPKEARFT